jgi:hypothetical protein
MVASPPNGGCACRRGAPDGAEGSVSSPRDRCSLADRSGRLVRRGG